METILPFPEDNSINSEFTWTKREHDFREWVSRERDKAYMLRSIGGTLLVQAFVQTYSLFLMKAE